MPTSGDEGCWDSSPQDLFRVNLSSKGPGVLVVKPPAERIHYMHAHRKEQTSGEPTWHTHTCTRREREREKVCVCESKREKKNMYHAQLIYAADKHTRATPQYGFRIAGSASKSKEKKWCR